MPKSEGWEFLRPRELIKNWVQGKAMALILLALVGLGIAFLRAFETLPLGWLVVLGVSVTVLALGIVSWIIDRRRRRPAAADQKPADAPQRAPGAVYIGSGGRRTLWVGGNIESEGQGIEDQGTDSTFIDTHVRQGGMEESIEERNEASAGEAEAAEDVSATDTRWEAWQVADQDGVRLWLRRPIGRADRRPVAECIVRHESGKKWSQAFGTLGLFGAGDKQEVSLHFPLDFERAPIDPPDGDYDFRWLVIYGLAALTFTRAGPRQIVARGEFRLGPPESLGP
jgi:hypothetical protein